MDESWPLSRMYNEIARNTKPRSDDDWNTHETGAHCDSRSHSYSRTTEGHIFPGKSCRKHVTSFGRSRIESEPRLTTNSRQSLTNKQPRLPIPMIVSPDNEREIPSPAILRRAQLVSRGWMWRLRSCQDRLAQSVLCPASRSHRQWLNLPST